MIKKEFLLLLTGVLIGSFLSYIIISWFTPRTNIISTKAFAESEQEQKLNITSSENNAQLGIEKKHIFDGNRENLQISIESQQSIVLSEKEFLRNELLSYIEELPVYKLKWTIEVLEKSKEPPANILFQQDSRNPAEAIIHEDNLRYNFYEHNVLDGYGDIGTLQCRSRYCLISITLTEDLPRTYSLPYAGVVLQKHLMDTKTPTKALALDIYIDLTLTNY